MTYKHFFQWNIPADNHYLGRTDWYIDVIATWNGDVYDDNKPYVLLAPCNIAFVDLRQVKNWDLATRQIEAIAQNHFAEIAKAERLAKARATLIAEGEPTGYPTLDRYTAAETELLTQQTLS